MQKDDATESPGKGDLDAEADTLSPGDHQREVGVPRQNDGLPSWVTITVVLTVLGLLVWNVVTTGAEGYPTTVILGGLLGAYAGVRELLNRRSGNGDK